MLVGYARVSSVGQSLDVQLARLAHCERIFQEKRSGTTDQRPELRACLSFVREGDTLVVTKLARLARSTLHLCTIAEQLASKGVQLDVLDQAIETRSPTGRLLFHVLGAIAEFETTLRKERQMEGIAHAKGRGVRFGRTHALSALQVDALRQRRPRVSLVSPSVRRGAPSRRGMVFAVLSVHARSEGTVNQPRRRPYGAAPVIIPTTTPASRPAARD
jgi:DNA invertase Pin-like site-specific DNA recombinase